MTPEENIALTKKTIEVDRRKGLPQMFSALELQSMEFPPVKSIIPGYIAEGATLLAGKPKLGKSWMVLDWCLAVAFGGTAFSSIGCEQGDVLYAALEDNKRRLQRRIRQLLPLDSTWPYRLALTTKAPRVDDGLLDYIRQWARSVAHPRFVVIDTLACVRPQRKPNEQPYAADYAAVAPLQALAAELGIAIVIVTHLRKMDGDDPLDLVSGTTGLTGGVDAVMVLTRDGQGCKLTGRGRDLEDIEVAVELVPSSGCWRLLGDAAAVRRSAERNRIIKALTDAAEPLGPKEIADATGLKYPNVKVMLPQMVKAGELVKAERGAYRIVQP